jgi:hypothetical protein
MYTTTGTSTAQHPCPACGPQCLCRPRFFAGQLLTEADLNALQDYVIEKDRRHNRYLHGWGVVCGLEVVCHPCPGSVTIRPGYAIGPYGEEIVVPGEYRLDLCDRIRECRGRKRKDWDCEPFAPPDSPESRDVEECWYVTVRYAEAESRGATALRAGSRAPCLHCGCNCGCQGHGTTGTYQHAGKASAATALQSRTPTAVCEPTRICEGYLIDVAPAGPKKDPDVKKLVTGTLLGGVWACLREWKQLIDNLPPFKQNATAAELHQDCCDLVRIAREFVGRHSRTHCDLLDGLVDLCRAPRPDEKAEDYRTNVIEPARRKLESILGTSMLECMCATVLPPCPEDPEDPRVILACVTVRGPDCKIVDICNARGRRQLVTVPTVLYWASVFPTVWEILERLCCGTFEERRKFNTMLFAPAGSGTDALAGPTAYTLIEAIVNFVLEEGKTLLNKEG